MARSTVLVVAATLALLSVTAQTLSPGRIALGAACVGGLNLLSLHRRRALTSVEP